MAESQRYLGKRGYVAAWYVKLAEGSAAPMPESVGLNPGQLALVPIAELSLRSQPVIAPQTAIRRIPVTEQLICLESADEAIPKIGVEGQWLHVKDELGKEGYVAAWYVRYASGSTTNQPYETSSTGPTTVR